MSPFPHGRGSCLSFRSTPKRQISLGASASNLNSEFGVTKPALMCSSGDGICSKTAPWDSGFINGSPYVLGSSFLFQ